MCFLDDISHPYTSTLKPKYLVLKKHVGKMILSAGIRAENVIKKTHENCKKILSKTCHFLSKIGIYLASKSGPEKKVHMSSF